MDAQAKATALAQHLFGWELTRDLRERYDAAMLEPAWEALRPDARAYRIAMAAECLAWLRCEEAVNCCD